MVAVATPERHATDAALEAVKAGGNALDAALAAAVTLTVTYPHNCGVGGDLFAVVRFPDRTAVSVNASGPAGRAASASVQRARGPAMPASGHAASAATHRARGPAMPASGPDTITVPGAVAGWGRLHALGARLSWADAFRHAHDHADHGLPMAPSLARAAGAFAADSGMAEVFGAAGPLR